MVLCIISLTVTLLIIAFESQAESAIPLSFRRVSSNLNLHPPILDTAQLILKFDEVIAETEQFAKIPLGKYNVSSTGAYSGASSPGGNPLVQTSPKYPAGHDKRFDLRVRDGENTDFDSHRTAMLSSAGLSNTMVEHIRKRADNEVKDSSSDSERSDFDSDIEGKGDMLAESGDFPSRRGRSIIKEPHVSREYFNDMDSDIVTTEPHEGDVERQVQDIMKLEQDAPIHKAENEVEPIAEEDEVVSDVQSDPGAAASADRATPHLDSGFGESLSHKVEQRSTRGVSANDSNLLRGRSRLGQVLSPIPLRP